MCSKFCKRTQVYNCTLAPLQLLIRFLQLHSRKTNANVIFVEICRNCNQIGFRWCRSVFKYFFCCRNFLCGIRPKFRGLERIFNQPFTLDVKFPRSAYKLNQSPRMFDRKIILSSVFFVGIYFYRAVQIILRLFVPADSLRHHRHK